MAEFYFSLRNIAQMAMDVEEKGGMFYLTLANLTRKKKLKDLFLALAKAETQHRDTFKNIADSFLEEDSSEYSIDISSHMKTYVDRLTEAVFNMQTFSHKPTTVQEALNIAIYTEEEAIQIYTEISISFVDKFHDILSQIIEEEKKHLRILHNIDVRL